MRAKKSFLPATEANNVTAWLANTSSCWREQTSKRREFVREAVDLASESAVIHPRSLEKREDILRSFTVRHDPRWGAEIKVGSDEYEEVDRAAVWVCVNFHAAFALGVRSDPMIAIAPYRPRKGRRPLGQVLRLRNECEHFRRRRVDHRTTSLTLHAPIVPD